MSGFVGVLHRDGRPMEAAPLDALTAALCFRGPDGAKAWRRGPMGFGHARFVTDPARDGEVQPIVLDDRWAIAGQIRLDARDDLIAALCHSERSEESRRASDAALALRAYRAWGDQCLQRLHGDYSFGIWDAARQTLFCARDRFGVRPFFYAETQDLLLFGNTLQALAAHPQVDTVPYEPALADYLVVGNLLEADRTFYRGIRRLPPAHSLSISPGMPATPARYWSLPSDPPLRYRRGAQYVEHFQELLSRAVAERCPPGAVTLFLSGGLDSGAIAAALTGKLGGTAHAGARGLCLGWDRVFADPEPALARASAQALGLPLTVHAFSDCEPFRGWDDAAGIGPEPEDDFYRANTRESLALAARHSRVALFGRGGDEILASETLAGELRRGGGARAVLDALATWATTRRRPPVGLRSWRRVTPAAAQPWIRVPAWLSPGWSGPLDAPARLASLENAAPRAARANARYRLGAARWTAGFEFDDAGFTRELVQCRYPFLDERVVAFALRLPPLPWCTGKHLLRRMLSGALPAQVVARRKTLLADEPLRVWAERHPQGSRALEHDAAALAGRIDALAWRQACAQQDPPDQRGINLWRRARVSALARWLQATRPAYATLRAVA